MLTPYEFGKEVGRRQSSKSIQEIRDLCAILCVDEENEFCEGFLNGFAEAEAEQDVPPWLPSDAELDEIEEGLCQCGNPYCEDPWKQPITEFDESLYL